MTTTTKAPPFACIALIAGVFLPVGASAQGCALIHPARLPPVSQCYETVKLPIGEIMSLFKGLDLSSFELVSARYERYREDGCPLDERSALGHPQDAEVVTREIETFTKAVRVGDLAGYKIHYGNESGDYHTSIHIDNPGEWNMIGCGQ